MTKQFLLSYFFLIIMITSCSENKVYYDIPELIRNDIDGARKKLKLLEDKAQPFRQSLSHRQHSYTIDGRTLIINFEPATRKITEISLVYPKGYSNKNKILKAGNLQEKTSHYECEVSTDDWSLSPFTSYNGVRIIPAN